MVAHSNSPDAALQRGLTSSSQEGALIDAFGQAYLGSVLRWDQDPEVTASVGTQSTSDRSTTWTDDSLFRPLSLFPSNLSESRNLSMLSTASLKRMAMNTGRKFQDLLETGSSRRSGDAGLAKLRQEMSTKIGRELELATSQVSAGDVDTTPETKSESGVQSEEGAIDVDKESQQDKEGQERRSLDSFVTVQSQGSGDAPAAATERTPSWPNNPWSSQ